MNINLRLTYILLAGFFSFAQAQNNSNKDSLSAQPKEISNEQLQAFPIDQSKQLHTEQPKDTLIVKPKSWVSINFGAAYPLGRFGETSGNYVNYAKRGYTGNIYAGIPLIPIYKSKLGIAVLFSYTFHSFDIDTYTNNIANADTAKARGNYQSASAFPIYKESNLMAGVFYSIPWKGTSLISFRALTGLMYCSFPEIIYQAVPAVLPPSASNSYYNEQWDIFSSISKTRVYDFGAECKGSLSKNVCLMINVDLLFANPVYKTNMQYQFYGNPNSTAPTASAATSVEASMPIRLFNLSLGIGIQVGK